MFVEFKKTLFKMGKFRIKAGFRIKGFGVIIYWFVVMMFYMMWYSLLAGLWLTYGLLWLMALPIKWIKKNLDSGAWDKAKFWKGFGIVIGVFGVIGMIGGVSGSHRNNVPDDIVTTQTEEAQTEETTNRFKSLDEDDELVRKFIREYNALPGICITNVERGNIRTKSHGSSNGCWVEIINANDAAAEAFCVSINGGNDEDSESRMFSVFKPAVKILDPTLEDEDIDAAITELTESTSIIENYVLGDNITLTYVPSREVSYGKTKCRIDISAKNYKE